jgi:glutamate-1-semialdehyde 2,1-aminomutase
MSRTNQQAFERAVQLIPGGVNSPVRAFGAVGGVPPTIASGSGARIRDVEGKEYIDYVGSWGPLILGHAHPDVVDAVQAVARHGMSFGAPTESEIEMAELITGTLPSVEQVRLVSSGTEATMTAIRLARGFTGRSKIVKFEGCYHGHADALLVKAGSGALTLGQPSSAGVPPEVTAHTLVLDYNNSEMLETVFRDQGPEIAAVIVEPIAGNMNFVKAHPEFLQAMRALCTHHGSVLIFDEVMTGFRVGLQGAQGRYGITPDITTLGKVIGGGMPVGAFGGRRDIMQQIAPLGPVYQAGTLSGNPVAVAAGLATLKKVSAPGFFDDLSSRTTRLVEGLSKVARETNQSFSAQSAGGMFGFYFRSQPPRTFAEVMESDREQFNRFFHAMLDLGVAMAPSAFEAGFVSSAHGERELSQTIDAARKALSQIS